MFMARKMIQYIAVLHLCVGDPEDCFNTINNYFFTNPLPRGPKQTKWFIYFCSFFVWNFY